MLSDPEEERHGFGPLRCLIAEDGAGARGYALYRAAAGWEDGTFLPDSKLVVRELVAADSAAGAALWRDLLSRDLVTEVTADLRPAEDPVLYQLTDPRRARPQVADGLWVRIIDVPAALSRRAYACPADVVIEVIDELLPGNAGRWRLTASGPDGGASCAGTLEPADVTLDVRELGAAYLGGTRLGTLAAAGLVTEARPGALRRLSTAMTWEPAPWCPRIFLYRTAWNWPTGISGLILGDMSGMRITPVSAMRARDVSRPRAEHLAAAAEREEAVTRHHDGKPAVATPSRVPPRVPFKAVPRKPVPPRHNG